MLFEREILVDGETRGGGVLQEGQLRAEVVPRLPSVFQSQPGEPVPRELVGATVVAIGTIPGIRHLEGGGLVIDFRTKANRDHRMVLAFNETGMWIEAMLDYEVAPLGVNPKGGVSGDSDQMCGKG